VLVDLDQEQPRTYVARGNPKLELLLTFGGGILFLIAIVFMLIALFSSAATEPNSRQPGIIGGLSVIPIMLIARGLFTMRNVTRVHLDKNAIALESAVSFKEIPWTQIERIQKKERSSFMGESHETLILIGADGKELAQIRDTLDRFPDLVQQVEYRSALARGKPVTEMETPEAVAAEVKKAKRRGRILGSVFMIFTLAMIAGAAVSLNEVMHVKKYATEGLTTNATIIRRYMNRQTPYVEFEFTDPTGQTHRREAMMEMRAWEDLVRSRTVAVEYIRSDPSWNRLVLGEDNVAFVTFWPFGLGGALLFGALAVFCFLGYDLKTTGGSFQVTRWGQPLDD
jgi:hypothetical protein